MSEKITVPLVSGLIAGIAASLCCAGPLVLLLLGFGGAWVSNLTALEHYRPIFIAVALTALVIAYFQLYKPKETQPCDQNKVCATRPTQQHYKKIFWGVVTLVIASIASPYLIALIYG